MFINRNNFVCLGAFRPVLPGRKAPDDKEDAMKFRQLISRRMVLGMAVSATAMLGLSVSGNGAAAAETISVTHAQGTTAVPVNPNRVAVFDLAALDTMFALGIKANGVPGGRVPANLEFYRTEGTPVVGTQFEPTMDELQKLNPDLIIVGRRSAKQFAELSKIAPTIDLSIAPTDYLELTRQTTRTLGRIYGKEKLAAERIKALEASLSALYAKTAKAGPALTVLTVKDKVIAQGPGARFGITHTDFGLQPAVTDFGTENRSKPVTATDIAGIDPDWLLVIDRDAAVTGVPAGQDILNSPELAATKAARNGRIVHLTPIDWYLLDGGLSNTQRRINQISEALDSAK